MNNTENNNRPVSTPETDNGIILNYRKPTVASGARIRSDSIRMRADERMRRHKKKSGIRLFLKFFGKLVAAVLAVAIVAVCGIFSVINAVAKGPSTTMRDQLVLMAMQASATKWVPGLFLDDATVAAIVEASHVVRTDITPIDSFTESNKGTIAGKTEQDIEWIDGIYYTTVSGPTYRAYVMLIKDPSRVYVGTTDFSTGAGIRIFEIAEKENAVAAINAGEYHDNGGQGIGDLPIGLTYSKGEQVHSDWYTDRTFIGINKDNKLVVKEGITVAEGKELNIRDGVCFQTGNVLITNDGTNVFTHYEDNNLGTAQRTAIGQRQDGTIIMVVTDGRSASSIGATHNDIIDVMREFGAVTAGMLDGGSSTMMYYRNYWDILGIDVNSLDEFQRMGIVNKYKAFTNPRKMPTYFVVAPIAGEN
jgi:exopolysaccharide biosynthesis protein